MRKNMYETIQVQVQIFLLNLNWNYTMSNKVNASSTLSQGTLDLLNSLKECQQLYDPVHP